MFTILISFVLLYSVAATQPPTLFGSVIRDLYPNYSDDLKMELMAAEWEVTGLSSEADDAPKVRICNGVPVLGGTGIVGTEGSFVREYADLPTHTMIYLDIGVKMIGNWKDTDDGIVLSIDDEQKVAIGIDEVGATDGGNSCGGSGTTDLDARLVAKIPHTADSVTLSLAWALASEGATGTLAIYDVSLVFSDDASGDEIVSLTLVDTTVVSLPEANVGTTSCKTKFYSNSGSCTGCNAACQDCFGSDNTKCYQCATNYNFIDDQCKQCASNCAICSAEGSGNCLRCNYGFTLGTDGTCTEDASPAHDCDSAYLYKYANGSCLDTCWTPYLEVWSAGYFCNKPCQTDYYLLETGKCSATCDTNNKKEDNGIKYCLSNGTCAAAQFKYENGSCLTTCPSPYKSSTVGTAKYCKPPCTDGKYYFPKNASCDKYCVLDEFYVKTEENITKCYEFCTLDIATDGSRVTTCKEASGTCEAAYFIFPDFENVCKKACPAGYTTSKKAICKYPCDAKKYLYASGKCLDSCLPGFTERTENDLLYCDNTLTATIQIYLRYDISLASWNTAGYDAKFLALIANLLTISSSDITILSHKEGSTIIEAEAVVKSGSTLTLQSKASAATQKLNDAYKAKTLNIETTAVLEKSFSVVIDEYSEPTSRKVTSEESSSNTVGIAIGVGAGVVALGAIIVGLRVYRFKVNQRESRYREETQEITYRTRDVEKIPMRTAAASQATSPNQSRTYNPDSRRKMRKSGGY